METSLPKDVHRKVHHAQLQIHQGIYIPWTQIITIFFRSNHKTHYETSELLAGALIIPPVIMLISAMWPNVKFRCHYYNFFFDFLVSLPVIC